MLPPKDNYQDSFKEAQQELRKALASKSPAAVARDLEKSGWTWEWACAAVETIEYQYNPAQLYPDARRSQEIREKLQMQASFGAGLFLVGLIVTFVTFAIAMTVGGLAIIAYGAVFVGAGLWLKTHPQLKKYPDRPLPKYVPPRDPKAHDPVNY